MIIWSKFGLTALLTINVTAVVSIQAYPQPLPLLERGSKNNIVETRQRLTPTPQAL